MEPRVGYYVHMGEEKLPECIVCGEELELRQKRFCGPGCRRDYSNSITEGSKDDYSDRLRDGFGAGEEND